jgi:hypothetical protein
MFSILDSVTMMEALVPVEKLTDWELFQSLASELIFSNIKIHSSNKADKTARDFAASIAYRPEIRNTWPRSFIKAYKKAQKIMARNDGSSIQNGSKLGHSKYQENGLEKST